VQSSLDPAGRGAERIAEIFWWMTGGAVAVWLIVAWLARSAIRGRVARQSERQARLYIIGGGAVFPTLVLAALLLYGLGQMPPLLAPPPPGSLRVEVTGEQYWWRVRYHPSDGSDAIVLANEIRLPVGEPVEFVLDSPDVIHSFWIPALGGKMDMVPGRRTRLLLEPTRTGRFRGQCAEFCGTSHAFMAFEVVVSEKADFDRWLAEQRAPARIPEDSLTTQGRELFFLNGCASCHALRGTEARANIGPDLTHVGGRLTLGAGLAPNDRASFIRWLGETDKVKPGVLMPHFGMLPREELNALAAYLDSLQ
jgi:cytochrome c oxidase subunit 2